MNIYVLSRVGRALRKRIFLLIETSSDTRTRTHYLVQVNSTLIMSAINSLIVLSLWQCYASICTSPMLPLAEMESRASGISVSREFSGDSTEYQSHWYEPDT